MIYSVWDPQRHVYKYYQGPTLPYGDVPAPRHLQPTALGVSAEDAAWPLPGNARPIGEGQEPRGMIAMAGSGTVSGSGWIVLVGLAITAYGLNKVLR